MSLLYTASALVVRGLFTLLTRCRVRGAEQVPPRGALIVAANHLSLIDPVLLMAVFPRPIRFMAKAELFQSRPGRALFSLYGCFPVRRGQPDRAALEEATALLQAGAVVGMFPEGTRSRSGQLQAGHPGAVALALRSGAPLLPVALWGTERIRAHPDLLVRHPIAVHFGRPYRTDRGGEGHREHLEEMTETLMERIAALLPEERRGAYGGSRKRWSYGGSLGLHGQ